MTATRITARRAETRARLLSAAFDVFAEEGFGRSSVEEVCERAGFTRGAFYSNFSSLDELFLAMWEERCGRLIADLRAALDGIDSTDPDEMIRRVLHAIPVEDAWFRVSLEFTAHALRNPPLSAAVAAREQAIQRTIVPIVAAALARAGRRVTDRAALGQALVAVHDGTAAQVLLQPAGRLVRRRRERLFRAVLEAYSEPATSPAAGSRRRSTGVPHAGTDAGSPVTSPAAGPLGRSTGVPGAGKVGGRRRDG